MTPTKPDKPLIFITVTLCARRHCGLTRRERRVTCWQSPRIWEPVSPPGGHHVRGTEPWGVSCGGGGGEAGSERVRAQECLHWDWGQFPLHGPSLPPRRPRHPAPLCHDRPGTLLLRSVSVCGGLGPCRQATRAGADAGALGLGSEGRCTAAEPSTWGGGPGC